MSAQTTGHINWVTYDADGVATGTSGRPHAYTLPNRPKPKKNTG